MKNFCCIRRNTSDTDSEDEYFAYLFVLNEFTKFKTIHLNKFQVHKESIFNFFNIIFITYVNDHTT